MVSETFHFTIETLVDPENADLLQRLDAQYMSGQMVKSAATAVCATTFFNGTLGLGRAILSRMNKVYGKGYHCDHINRNPADNRRMNLRVVTASESLCNRDKYTRWVPDTIGHTRTYNLDVEVMVDTVDADFLQRLVDLFNSGKLNDTAGRKICREQGRTFDGTLVMGIPAIVLARRGIFVPRGMAIDHINDNPADNRRCNLMIVTPSQNNKKKGISAIQSQYVGVCWYKNRYKWMAYCSTSSHGKKFFKNLGLFDNELDAAVAYDRYVIENRLNKELNFGNPFDRYSRAGSS